MRWAAFDRWAARSPVSVRDLSIFRIVYAAISLFIIARAGFSGSLPTSAFRPPWGPLRLIPGTPPGWSLVVASILASLAAAFLLVGLFSRTSALVLGVTELYILGVSFSYGKIDHEVMIPAVAIIFAWSSWGEQLSLDALRGRARSGQPWIPRVLALALGVGFFTAGWAKLTSGWLRLDGQAARVHVLHTWATHHSDPILNLLHDIPSRLLWEAVDWSTVALELGLIVAALWWPSFRIGIALATLFHLGIAITLRIAFSYNLLAYAAFIPWAMYIRLPDTIALPPWLRRALGSVWPVLPVLLVLAALSWIWGNAELSHNFSTRSTLVTTGAAIGAAYLVAQAWRLLGWARARRPAPEDEEAAERPPSRRS